MKSTIALLTVVASCAGMLGCATGAQDNASAAADQANATAQAVANPQRSEADRARAAPEFHK